MAKDPWQCVDQKRFIYKMYPGYPNLRQSWHDVLRAGRTALVIPREPCLGSWDDNDPSMT